MGPLVGVNGDDSNMDMAVEEEADGSKGTLGDSYVRQLQPFNMYPFSCNRAETLSLCRKERREASRLSETEKANPTTSTRPKQEEQLIFLPHLSVWSSFKNSCPLFYCIRYYFPETHTPHNVRFHVSLDKYVAVDERGMCHFKPQNQHNQWITIRL